MMRILKKVLITFMAVAFTQSVFAAEMTAATAKKYRERFVEEARACLGCPYKYGSAGPSSFDCSGLINYTALNATGINLPRTARAIYNHVKIIPKNECEIGDLLFFRTTDDNSISHIGIYIGNDQFISALSEGVNRGVSISSLSSSYWKPKYVATGQFLPSGDSSKNSYNPAPSKKTEDSTDTIKQNNTYQSEKTNTPKSSGILSGSKFLNNFILDTTMTGNWSLISPDSFAFNFRGADVDFNLRYAGWDKEPGLRAGFTYDPALKLIQIPLTLSLTINDNIRAYAGPVFSFGTPDFMGTGKEIQPSFFPGIIGLTFSTNNLRIGQGSVQFIQDISYTVYNNKDNSALSLFDSLATGLVFRTGLRFSLPLSAM